MRRRNGTRRNRGAGGADGPSPSRKGSAWIAVAGLVVLLVAPAIAEARANADAEGVGSSPAVSGSGALAKAFANPPAAVLPSTYWWLPQLDAITAEGIEADIHAMADAGIGAVLPYRRDFAMPANESDRHLLVTALQSAKRHGMKLDLSLAETATAPSITATSAAAQQELVYGSTELAAGQSFDGPLPPPSTEPERPRQLVAAVAARCTTSCQTAKPVMLDQSTIVDLTPAVQGGELHWTAPAGEGHWVLLSFWARSALYHLPFPGAPGAPYADHLSERGAKAITAYFDDHILTPQVESLLDQAGGVLHEDSLHLAGYHLWSPDLLSEFLQRRGYSLRKYLPVSIIANVNDFFTDTFGVQVHTDSPADFDFAGDAGKRIRNDYFQTLSELYQQKYLMTLQRWAQQHRLGFRAQVAYGQTFSTSAAAQVDVPMTEAFQLGDHLDGYRSMAGAVHMGGRNLFPVECCVQVSGTGQDNYATTWKGMLSVIHNTFAGGANEVTLHGVTYPDGPGATWPGFSNFDGFFSEELGPRMPYWHDMPDLMRFLGREQLILRQGQPKLDVAIYRQSYWDYGFPALDPFNKTQCSFPAGCDLFNDRTLERAGYTYEFVDPSLFDLPGATVRNGRLSPDRPAYKALVLNSGQRNSVDGMPLKAARQILGYARAGLPIVVVGAAPDRTGFFGDAQQDPEVHDTIARLLDQPSVRRVSSEAEVAPALEALGVDAAARPAQPSNLLSFRRTDVDASYYFLWNQNRVDKVTGEPDPKPEAFNQAVSFEGRGQPYVLDAWTGKISPIATYERHGDRISTRLRLEPGEAAIIAIGPESWQRSAVGVTSPAHELHATSTTADDVSYGRHDELRIRATRPGSYTTRLSNGRTVKSTIGALPPRRTLSAWHLSVDDWQPGQTATETVHVQHELDLDPLRTWPDVPELEDVSGVGHYTTQVNVGSEWTDTGRGALLELGPVFDSVRLQVNGEDLGYVDPDNPRVDISRYLRAGTNTIEVEVATTLRNRVRTVRPAHAGFERQPYGLVGPVRLVPYGEREAGLR
jgi:alpha-L-rhamnosidase